MSPARHGAALFRTGQYAEAERTLAEPGKAHGKGGFTDTWLWQALTARQRGRHDEADRLLTKCEA